MTDMVSATDITNLWSEANGSSIVYEDAMKLLDEQRKKLMTQHTQRMKTEKRRKTFDKLSHDLGVWKKTATKKTPSSNEKIGRRLGSLRREVATKGRDAFEAENPGVIEQISGVLGTTEWMVSQQKVLIPREITDSASNTAALYEKWSRLAPSNRERIPLPGEAIDGMDIGQWLYDNCEKADRFTRYEEHIRGIATALGFPVEKFRERVHLSHKTHFPMPDEVKQQFEILRLWKTRYGDYRPYPLCRETVDDSGVGAWLQQMVKICKQEKPSMLRSLARYVMTRVSEILEVEETFWRNVETQGSRGSSAETSNSV